VILTRHWPRRNPRLRFSLPKEAVVAEAVVAEAVVVVVVVVVVAEVAAAAAGVAEAVGVQLAAVA
jgi:hypothetical protein